MRSRSVHYNLDHGFINNWLSGGPQAIKVEPGQFKGENIRRQIAGHFHMDESGIAQTPVERGPLTEGLFQIGDYAGSWEYYACREDHQVDHSGVFNGTQFLRSWAYSQIESRSEQGVLLVLTVYGGLDLWLNNEHILRQENDYSQEPVSKTIKIDLKKGTNQVLVCFENVGTQVIPHSMALQVCKNIEGRASNRPQPVAEDAGISVSIPSLIQALARRNKFEAAARRTYTKQDVFEAGDQIWLHWPKNLKQPSEAVVRLLTANNQIYAEANVKGTAGDQLYLQTPSGIPAGPYQILIMPLTWEYYDRNLRITHETWLSSLGTSLYSQVPYGTYAERRLEALRSASRHEDLFSEIAKMALNQWEAVEIGLILKATSNIRPRDILGLLGMLYRFGDHANFPKELSQPLEECVLRFSFGGEENFESDSEKYEDEQILTSTVEILAGQRYPDRIFVHSGKTGEWHRKNGEYLTQAWLKKRGRTGFADWDSSSSFAEYFTALSHLIDLAESQPIWEMAAIVMDKLFVTLAINSYKGSFGSSHGRIAAAFVKGSLLEPTSGIARLSWGTGIYNLETAGWVSLACMENYDLPSVIANIALAMPDEMWSQERHTVGASREVNKVTYRTPDGMLCSAQDYYAGQKGVQEHIWQATLGAAAAVFVNHPGCSSESEARRPNFWAGNACLPRVAQWKDALIAIHQIPEDDWMGFTHAYFPTQAFDEYSLRQGWAFARKGEGYLAITSQRGFSLVQEGYHALRELRSPGRNNIWICQMGRKALDGDFSSFQEKILALNPKFTEGSVRFTSLRDEELSFGWQGLFLRDGQEMPLRGFEHYENLFTTAPHPCQAMEIQFGEEVLRLNFEDSSEDDNIYMS